MKKTAKQIASEVLEKTAAISADLADLTFFKRLLNQAAEGGTPLDLARKYNKTRLSNPRAARLSGYAEDPDLSAVAQLSKAHLSGKKPLPQNVTQYLSKMTNSAKSPSGMLYRNTPTRDLLKTRQGTNELPNIDDTDANGMW